MITPKIVRFLAVAVVAAGFSTVAHGQGATRTWVSGTGADANPCSRTAPCQTFAGAFSKTATNGEISALDPGGFGTINITKSITLNGDGTLASILNAGTTGIIVNITTNLTTDIVVVRNVSIQGAGTGTDGVRFIDGHALMLDDVKIGGVTDAGVDVTQVQNSGISLRNVTISKCSDGVRLNTTAGVVTATINNTEITNCSQDGIEAAANVRLGLRDSLIARATANGVMTSGANNQLNLDDVMITNCDLNGIRASAGSSIRVSDSIIANNTTGLMLLTVVGAEGLSRFLSEKRPMLSVIAFCWLTGLFVFVAWPPTRVAIADARRPHGEVPWWFDPVLIKTIEDHSKPGDYMLSTESPLILAVMDRKNPLPFGSVTDEILPYMGADNPALRIEAMRDNLEKYLPKVCYFGSWLRYRQDKWHALVFDPFLAKHNYVQVDDRVWYLPDTN